MKILVVYTDCLCANSNNLSSSDIEDLKEVYESGDFDAALVYSCDARLEQCFTKGLVYKMDECSGCETPLGEMILNALKKLPNPENEELHLVIAYRANLKFDLENLCKNLLGNVCFIDMTGNKEPDQKFYDLSTTTPSDDAFDNLFRCGTANYSISRVTSFKKINKFNRVQIHHITIPTRHLVVD